VLRLDVRLVSPCQACYFPALVEVLWLDVILVSLSLSLSQACYLRTLVEVLRLDVILVSLSVKLVSFLSRDA